MVGRVKGKDREDHRSLFPSIHGILVEALTSKAQVLTSGGFLHPSPSTGVHREANLHDVFELRFGFKSLFFGA